MRILQAHKFFYRRGGAEAVFLDTIAGLRARGHEVAEFSMRHPKNLPSAYDAYFVDELPELGKKQSWGEALKVFSHLFYSGEVKHKLRALVYSSEPQVAHLHNVYHHLSAGIFTMLKKMGLPVVATVHDVFPMCPNHRMLRPAGEVCEKCFNHRFYNCARYKCINNRRGASLAGSLEAYFYYLRDLWQMVDLFLCPSEFMLQKMTAWGFPRQKLRLLHNPYEALPEPKPLGSKVVYLNRLHAEKGIRLFMEAAAHLREYCIVVAGDGPDEGWVDDFIRQRSLTHVERLPRVSGEAWNKVVAEARVMVVPSWFYENCSLTILEALSHGRLVVTTDRGGNRELIKTGETGWLVKPENPEALSEAIRQAMQVSSAVTEKIIANGRNLIKAAYNPKDYFEKLEEYYEEAIGLNVK